MSNADKQRTALHLRRADAARRTAEAWRLRTEQGLGWDEIAARVGYANGPNALRAVRRWRDSLPAIDVTRMRDEAIARGEWLVRMAAEDVAEDRPGAVTAMVRAEGRLAALCGLDAPTRSQVVVDGGMENFWATIYTDNPGPRLLQLGMTDAQVVETSAVD